MVNDYDIMPYSYRLKTIPDHVNLTCMINFMIQVADDQGFLRLLCFPPTFPDDIGFYIGFIKLLRLLCIAPRLKSLHHVFVIPRP